jgi:Rrf2 family protein
MATRVAGAGAARRDTRTHGSAVERDNARSSEAADGNGSRPLTRRRKASRRRAPARERRARSGERSSLMHVGRRVDYAVRALAYLAGQEPGRVVGRAEIEVHQGIPRYFLSKILRALVAAGMLESVAGARGGFRLRGPASGISIRRVYEALEGELCLIDCVRDRGSACCFASVCTQIEVWRGAQRLLLDYLDRISIAAVADGTGLRPRLDTNCSLT